MYDGRLAHLIEKFSVSRFWILHAVLPALLFAFAAALFEVTTIDFILANSFYDFTAQQWPHRDSWWSSQLIHVYGRRMITALFMISLGMLIGSYLQQGMKQYRRPTAYMVLVLMIASGIVSIGKHLSNVDCPWNLDLYGGERPYIKLFADRPDNLPPAQCFPGGHSSGGFALFGLYFLFRNRNSTLARLGLAIGAGIGGLFAFGQEARGAHFLSHDIWSAFICWFMALGIYTLIFKQQLWPEQMRR